MGGTFRNYVKNFLVNHEIQIKDLNGLKKFWELFCDDRIFQDFKFW